MKTLGETNQKYSKADFIVFAVDHNTNMSMGVTSLEINILWGDISFIQQILD